MNRKKVAWLLTAAMVATSVDSSALVASGADFSSEPVENVQDFSDEAVSQSGETETVSQEEAGETATATDEAVSREEAGETSAETEETATEAAVNSTETADPEQAADTASSQQAEADQETSEGQKVSAEGGETVTSDTPTEQEPDQDLTLGDGTEEITQTPQDSGQSRTETDHEDITDPEKGSVAEAFSSDSQDMAVQSETFDSTMAASAIELSYKDFTDISQVSETEKTVFRFTVEKSGKYRIILGDASNEYTDHIPVYDSAYKECEVEDGDVITCQAGETYYAVYEFYSVSGDAIAGVFPTIESFEMKQLPEMDYIMWDGYADLSGKGAVISCTYSNGETEELSEAAGFDFTLLAEENDFSTSYLYSPGTYQGSLEVYKNVNGFNCQLYKLKNTGQVHARDFEQLVQDKKSEAIELKGNGETTETEMKDQLFHFRPEETDIYNLTAGEDPEEDTYGKAVLLDENGAVIKNGDYGRIAGAKLTAGKDYYLAVRERKGYPNMYARVTQAKKIQSVEVSQPEIAICMGQDSLYKNDLLDKVNLTIKYVDGSEETQNCYGMTSEGQEIEVDYSNVAFDDSGNAKEGEYTVPISVADQKLEVKLRVQKFSDYCNERSSELTLGQEFRTTVSEDECYYYKLTAPEDGYYTFQYRAVEEDQETGEYDYNVRYYDSEGNSIEERSELKAGETVYVKMVPVYGSGYEFCITGIKKDYTVTSLQIEAEPTDKTYVEKLDFKSTAEPKTEGLKVKVTYSDGIEEILTEQDTDRDGNKLQMRVVSEYDYDNDTDIYKLQIALDGVNTSLPVTYMTLKQYISTLDRDSVEKLEPDKEKNVQWNGAGGRLYSFTPATDGTYIFTSEGDADTYGYLLDENGELIDENDEEGGNGNFKLSNSLEAGKTYYYLARPYNRSNETATLKLYKKDEIAKVAIKNPDKTTFTSGFDEVSYSGLEVNLTFESGKTFTCAYDEEGFSKHIDIEPGFDRDDNSNIIPGTYDVKLLYDGEEIGSIPVMIRSFADYIAENPPKELKAGQSIKEKHEDDEQEFYSFTAPESGEYFFRVNGKSEDGESNYSRLAIYDRNGTNINEDNGAMQVKLEAGVTYYLNVSFWADMSEACEYTISAKACRTLKKITLGSRETDLYAGIDDLSWDNLHNIIRKIDVTLSFTNGTADTIHYGKTTEDNYSVSVDIPDLDGTPGDYDVLFSIGDISVKYTIHVHSALDYIAKNATEIQAGKRTPVVITAESTQAYCAVAQETGYYKVSYLGNTEAEISYYDQQGSTQKTAVKVEKGQKFYFTLKNNESRNIRALVTVETQEAVLEKLTVKTLPPKTTLVEKIDYEYTPSDGGNYAEGMVVTAQYTDGKTEDLKYGDTSRFGSKLDAYLILGHDGDQEEITDCFVNVSMDGIESDRVPIKLVSFKDYLKDSGDKLETLKVNTDKATALEPKKYQVYSFIPEKDGIYTFFSKGNIDTYGYLYNGEGKTLESDDDSGTDMNFQMQQELTAGTRYYLAVKGYKSGDTILQVSDGSGSEEEKGELSDFKLVSMPKNTVFFGYNENDTLEPNYSGLKVSAKDKSGKTHVYTYGSGSFPFQITDDIERQDDRPSAGKYTVALKYNQKAVLSFQIEVKDFKDYLAENTTLLKPGETVTDAAENPMTYGNFCYFRLPSDLKGVYWNSGDRSRWTEYGIYDDQGKRTELKLGNGTSWDFSGKTYYLCLRDNRTDNQGAFSYNKIDTSGVIRDVEIISQPEVTEFLKGMNGSIDLTGMMIRIRYEDGTEKKVPVIDFEDLYGREVSILDEDGDYISRISELHEGTNNLRIEIGGIRESFQLTLTDPAKKDAEGLVLNKESVFSVSDSIRSHVYSYTPDKDGEYYFQTETGSHSSYGLSDNLKWFCTDSDRDYVSRENMLDLEGGKTYYFVVYSDKSGFGDVSVKLRKVSDSVDEDADVVDMEITPPTKTEYTADEEISYEGMKIHAIYDDGTENDYTAEDAEKLGFEIWNTVDTCGGRNLPGDYRIMVRHIGDTGFSVTKEVPVTVNNTGVSSIKLSENEVEVKAEENGSLYEYEISESGYYQIAVAGKSDAYVECVVQDNDNAIYSYGNNEKTAYSSLMYLESGKHYIYFRNNSPVTAICGIRLYHYNSAPQKLEVIEDTAKTEFIYGQEQVSFAGMKVKITYADGSEKTVTIGDQSGYTIEGGVSYSDDLEFLGDHRLRLGLAIVKQGDQYDEITQYLDYKVRYPDDMTELKTGKTYTIKPDTLKKQAVIYTVTGSEKDNELCEIQYEGSGNIDIQDEEGNSILFQRQYTDKSGKIYFMAEKGITYHISVNQNKNADKDMTIKLSEKKSVTKITALPEEGTTYYYGVNDKDKNNIRVQLTYADGSTEILDQDNIKFWLTYLNMENISGPGTYSGVLSIGNVKTIYRREILDPSAEEIKKDQNVKLNEGKANRRFKFVPEKTQKYYIQMDMLPEDNASVSCKNAEGAYLGRWYIHEEMDSVGNADDVLEMVLTAGKTYYFDVNYKDNVGGGTFVITDQKPVITDFVESRCYTYTGSEIRPKLKVTYNGKELTEGKDYQLKYTNNVNAGIAQVEIIPVSGGINFAMRTMVFDIDPQSLEFAKAVIEPIPDQQYTGNELTPEVKVSVGDKTLVSGRDYEVSYKDNIEPGTAEVTVEGNGNYHGTVTGTFKIVKNKKDFTKAELSGIAASYDYTGKAITPVPVVKYEGKTLKAGTDYSVTYVNNTKAGTATVKITGKGNYQGEKSATFKIQYKQVTKVTLNKTSATVIAGNSLQLKAAAAPSDAYNKSVKWTSSNTSLATVTSGGKVTVKPTATGGSTVKITATAADGSKKSAVCTIKINNKITYNLNGGKQNSKNKTTFCKQNVKLYNPTRSGYTFGGWYTDKGLKKKITSITSKTVKNVTLYAKWVKVSKCKAPAGVKAVNSKAKTLTVSYKAASGAKGYEISYSTSAKFSGAKKILTTARSKAIGSLKKGATYYVRVRAYKTDSTGAKIYGNYSKTVKVAVKK